MREGQKINPNLRFLLHKVFVEGRDIVCLRGGTRSGKTYSALEFILYGALTDRFRVSSVVSMTYPHLERGAKSDFRNILKARGVPYSENKQKGVFELPNGAIVQFFSADKAGKMTGAQRDLLFMNEANYLTKELFDQLAPRTAKVKILDYNPVARFWIHDYLRLAGIPEDEVEITTTYKDNPFLTEAQIAEIERRRADTSWWRVYGEGQFGSDGDNIITNYSVGDFDGTIIAYGIDMGYGYSPSALVGLYKITGDKPFGVRELAYGYYTPLEFGEIVGQSTERGVPIFMDFGAGGKEVANSWVRGGLVGNNIYEAQKHSLQYSYARINEVGFVVSPDSLDLLRELMALRWADKTKGIPFRTDDHAIDALRYAIHPFLVKPKPKRI